MIFLQQIEGVIDACCSSNVKLKLPITIGTFPIRDDEPAFTSNVFTISYPRPVIIDQPRAQQIQMKEITPSAPEMPISMPMPSAPTLPASNINPTSDRNDSMFFISFLLKLETPCYLFQIFQLMRKPWAWALIRKIKTILDQNIQCSTVKLPIHGIIQTDTWMIMCR